MKLSHCAFVAAFFLVTGMQMHTRAHFKLIEPPSWLVENERGDPQKAGPCGGTNTDWGKPSNAVGKAAAARRSRSRCWKPSTIPATIASRWR